MSYEMERTNSPKIESREPVKLRLRREEAGLQRELQRIQKCLALLEEHPEFETFMDTFNR